MRLFLLLTTLPFFCHFAHSVRNLDSLKQVGENSSESFERRINSYKTLSQTFQSKSLDTALFFANEGLKLAESEGDYSIQAIMYDVRADAYLSFFKKEDANENILMAVDFAKKSRKDSILILMYNSKGGFHAGYGESDSALYYFQKSLELSTLNNYPRLELISNYNCGITYTDMQLFPKANTHFTKALELTKIVVDQILEARLHLQIGRMYYFLGNFEKSIENEARALELAENNQDYALLANILDAHARSHNVIGEYETSIKMNQNALLINRSLGRKSHESWGYNALAISYELMENYDSSLYYYQKSLDLKTAIGDSVHLGFVTLGLATSSLYANETENAKKYLTQTLEIVAKAPDMRAESQAYLLLGEIYADKDTEKGLTYYNQALAVAEEYNLTKSIHDCYLRLYEHHKKQGNYKKSLHFHEKYIALDSIFSADKSRLAMAEISVEYQEEQKDNEIKFLEKNQEISAIQLANTKERSKLNLQITILGFGIILLIIIILIARYRQRQKNKILAFEKRNLKIETDKLRSQINPHFIFNSLNSIQSFISGNETIDAERYLSKFSRLMRLILENSRKSFIDFENELETLKLYLELEQMRFNQKFKYEILLDGIDEEFTQVPPMLAQPYIENAVLHGVRTIDNGLIRINYTKKGEKITCTIDDNGIGREKAAEFKSIDNPKKNSLGIRVTQDRIDLLSQEYNLDLAVNVIDKKGGENRPEGTQVILEMPWIE